MQSSPVSNSESSISTSDEDSGLQPSLLGPCETTVTLRTITLCESTGWMTHMGALRMVTPSISTFRAAVGLDEARPQEVALAEDALRHRDAVLRHLEQRGRARASGSCGPVVFFHGHQCVASAWPSSVPSPVMATFVALVARRRAASSS